MTIKRYRMEAQAEFGQEAWAVEVERPKGEWVRYADLRREPAAIEAPAQKPVAWQQLGDDGKWVAMPDGWGPKDCENWKDHTFRPLYTTPADAEAHLTALLRAEYERGVKEAAKACDWGDIYGDNAVRCILALLTQEGR